MSLQLYHGIVVIRPRADLEGKGLNNGGSLISIDFKDNAFYAVQRRAFWITSGMT
jgi:hypothetical protein